MLMVNSGGHALVTDEFGGLSVPIGGEVDIPDGYCKAGVYPNGTRRPSIVERLAPMLVPADPALRKVWGTDQAPAPVPPAPTVAQVTASLVSDGLPPAVAELVAAGNVEPPKRKPGRPRKAAE
jgi:hypothetical protein